MIELRMPAMHNEAAISIEDEGGLVARAKAMDDAAWAHLLHAYYPRLRAYIWNRIGDDGAAEDLAAQVFEEAVTRIGDYEWRGLPFGAWLFRIARNISTDFLRKRARRTGIAFQAAEPAPLSRGLEQRVETQQLRQALQ
ncbi:MAG: sigma-70 family RNA polymerase sigma factor, partial [Chloroflexi bacterium]|nr:sigma-70 family RNA polymerase sigma factor [Chloroflexota bacterium]